MTRILAAIVTLSVAACSPVHDIGPAIVADAERIDSRSQRPAQSTWVKRQNAQLDRDGNPVERPASHTLNIAGPSTNIVEIGPDGISQAGSGPAGQAITLRQEDGTEIKAFSQTNLRAARRTVTGPDGTTTVEVTFDSDSASSTVAFAAQIDAAVASLVSLDQAQRDSALAAIRANSETWRAFFDTVQAGLYDAVLRALGS